MFFLIFFSCNFLQSASFRIPDNKNIIILGDSTTANGIDDTIFSGAVNMSQGATAYFYSYIKLRKFLKENPHLSKVIVAFHYTAINESEDDLVNGKKNILNKVPRYLFLFNMNEKIKFLNKPGVFHAAFKSIRLSAEAIPKLIKTGKVSYSDLKIGDYSRVYNNRLGVHIEHVKKKNTNNAFKYSQDQHEYLLKIVELCRDKNVELLLLNTPMYNLDKYIDTKDFLDYYNFYFSETKFLDFSNFVLPEYGYADLIHLHYKGAEIFSQYLSDNYKEFF